MKPEEFVQHVSAILNARIGAVIAGSIMKNNLAKIKKDAQTLSPMDCRTLVENIVKSVAVFETKEETRQVQTDLEKLLEQHLRSL